MMAEATKMEKWQHGKEDRISALPDSLIQHILSLLPSTKEAIKTSVLSKRWRSQWTRVPVLVFSNSGMSDERFSRFIDNTLLLLDSSSKIQKFHIQSENYQVVQDPTFNSKLHFLATKGVEELLLDFKESVGMFRLPSSIFNYASLVKLRMYWCRIITNGVVSWDRLKELIIHYSAFQDVAFENILIGSPLLESVQMTNCVGFSKLKIASESLKKVVLQFMFGQASEFEILCPKLEDLKLLGNFGEMRIIFKDLSSLSCATLDIYGFYDVKSSFEILQQFQHVKELMFRSKFIEALSKLRESDGLCNLSLSNKSLTLDQPDFRKHYLGIERALFILPKLEKLVIKDLVHEVHETAGLSTKCWGSNVTALRNLVPCLKTLHIVDPRKSSESKVPFDFVEFIVNSSPVFEKLVLLKD